MCVIATEHSSLSTCCLHTSRCAKHTVLHFRGSRRPHWQLAQWQEAKTNIKPALAHARDFSYTHAWVSAKCKPAVPIHSPFSPSCAHAESCVRGRNIGMPSGSASQTQLTRDAELSPAAYGEPLSQALFKLSLQSTDSPESTESSWHQASCLWRDVMKDRRL